MVDYRAVDFMSGMVDGTMTAKNVERVLSENPGWDPVLFCDGPHTLAPILILRKSSVITARKVPQAKPEFVCSDCGGDITEEDKVCPHCGAPIEGD
jgi:hypothetical protein